MKAGRSLSKKAGKRTCRGKENDDDPGWQLPDGQQQKAGERQGEIARRQDRVSPDRIIERRAKDADNGSVRAAHGGLRNGTRTQGIPERQHAIHQQQARQLKRLLSVYEHNRDLVAIGAYRAGADPRIDAAIAAQPSIAEFLRQDLHERFGFADSVAQLDALIGDPA